MEIGDFLFDCKSTRETKKQTGKSLTITAKMWNEICFHAENDGQIPGWAGSMEGIELIMIRRKDFEAVFDELAELRRKVEELNVALRTKEPKAKPNKPGNSR